MQKISRAKSKSIGKDGKTIYSIALTKNEESLYVALDTKNIRVYDTAKNKLQGIFIGLNEFYFKINFKPFLKDIQIQFSVFFFLLMILFYFLPVATKQF